MSTAVYVIGTLVIVWTLRAVIRWLVFLGWQHGFSEGYQEALSDVGRELEENAAALSVAEQAARN